MKPTANNARTQDVLKRSSLYQEFLAEREEILRHKWIESEKIGRDIGFERALLDWIRNHRDGWRAARRRGSRSRGESDVAGRGPMARDTSAATR